MSIARYSFIQLSDLEQYRVKKLAQGFNTGIATDGKLTHQRPVSSSHRYASSYHGFVYSLQISVTTIRVYLADTVTLVNQHYTKFNAAS